MLIQGLWGECCRHPEVTVRPQQMLMFLLCLSEISIIAVGVIVPPSPKLPGWIRQRGDDVRQAGFSLLETSLIYHLRNDVKQLKFDDVFKSYTSDSYSILNCWFCYKPGSKPPISLVKKLHNHGVKVFHACLSGLTWGQRLLLPPPFTSPPLCNRTQLS